MILLGGPRSPAVVHRPVCAPKRGCVHAIIIWITGASLPMTGAVFLSSPLVAPDARTVKPVSGLLRSKTIDFPEKPTNFLSFVAQRTPAEARTSDVFARYPDAFLAPKPS